MSDIFGSTPPRRDPESRSDRGRRVLIPTIVTLAVLLVAGSLFVSLWTERLWYRSVDFQGVFTTVLLTRSALFVAFAVFGALVIGVNVWLAHRNRPNPLGLRRDDPAARYRMAITPIARWALLAVALFVGLFSGIIGSSRWETFQLWLNGESFGRKDPHFGKDVGFYVFDMPWLQFIVSYLFALLLITAIAVAFVHYVFGGIRLANKGPKFSRAAQIQVAVLIGLAMLVRAANYWLDRYAMAYDNSGLFDGITYTAANAEIPAKNILMVVAILCALMFFSTIFLGSWTLPALGLGLWFLTSLLIGAAWPAIMQQFQVNPSEPDREGPYLEENIKGTREAFGVADVGTNDYSAKTELTPKELSASAESRVSTRLLDPTLISPAFQQLQQVRGYYTVPKTLDVDRYALGDNPQPQDVIIAAREVDLEGLQATQRTWSNDHTVYTHGYGVIAAYGNKRGSQGEPVWVAKDIPPTGDLKFDGPPRIYFGESSPSYSIVGRPDDAAPIEVDTPRGGASDDEEAGDSTANTYDGKGGVEMGSLFRQVLYAFKFAEPKIVLSDRVNENSKILYDRHPRERVRKVAPWLTLDGDTYPAVVDGKVVWIVDGYTTSNTYPYSESRSLATATSDTLTEGASQIALPTDQVNYMRNSVKAVVDAYDGTVTLYEWDTEDPILKTWSKVFPDAVEPKSKITPALLQHLRYPVDMFKVQRDVLSRYHVTNAQTFYEDGERWKIPEDPSAAGSTKQPPYYLSTSGPGDASPKFSLTSVYLPNNRQNLAAFMSVNSEASDVENYGKLEILELPSDTRVGGPNQIAAQFESDAGVRAALLQYEQSQNTRILRGNLLTLPVSGAMLYVQPIYIQRVGEGSYPVLQLITATFGDGVGVGQTLDEALRVALGLEEGTTPEAEPAPEGGGEAGGAPAPAKTAEQYLSDASRFYDQAQAALEDGDLATYQARIDDMAEALAAAQRELEK
ncbi:UPF0182 family protein [Aeromicrobium sp. 636]|uniref:UPF0182 protein IBG24_08965 n=1 Tax=Aeromicrobium senzhongii TaxID=2663859 RepID=A0A8I0K0J8_9ACTN|nr:UPF0182 family protein [Aeromicrobium sp. 636]MBC9226446.1 UPF0182 family protein [Aeromicrobium senzhongii]MCQ3998550.1 UPF0182 family protein [Aeromicrobium sp. 636]